MKYSVFLRPFKEEDTFLINKWRNDYEVQRLTGGPIKFVSLEMEREWVRKKMLNNTSELYLAICLNEESHKMVGYLSLNNIDHLNKCAFAGGIVIGDREFRDGVTSIEAMKLLLEYSFFQLNLNRIGASCLTSHYYSPFLLMALGFQKEGLEREAIYKNGKYQDKILFSLLKKEYIFNLKDENINTIIRRLIKYKKDSK